MTAIWQNDGSVWHLLTPTGFPNEDRLHTLVEQAPQMLPLAGMPQLIVLGREVQLGNGYADLIAIEPSGRIAIIEINELTSLPYPGRITCKEQKNKSALVCKRSGSMQKENKSENTLPQQLADFKQQNPKVAEAMELFGITLTKYQETLHALYSPLIYQSTSTARLDKPNQ